MKLSSRGAAIAQSGHCEEHSDEANRQSKQMDCFASLAMTKGCNIERAQCRKGAMTGDQRGSFTKPAAKAVPVKIMAAQRITQVVMTSFKKAMPMTLANSGIK